MIFSRDYEFPVTGRTQLNEKPIEIFPKEVTISFELLFDEAPFKKFNILHIRPNNGPYIFDVECLADEDGLIAFSCFRDKANPEIVTDTFSVFPGEWFKIEFSQFMTDLGYHFTLTVDGRAVFDTIPNPNPFDFTGVTVHASLDKKIRQPVKMRNFVIEDTERTNSVLDMSDLVSETADLTLTRSAQSKDCIEDLPSDFEHSLDRGHLLDMNPALMSTLITPKKRKAPQPPATANETVDAPKSKSVSNEFEPFQEAGMTILEPPEDDDKEEEVFSDTKQTDACSIANDSAQSPNRSTDASATPSNSSLPFVPDPDMDSATRELILSLLEEDEVREPRPPPGRDTRPSLPLDSFVPPPSQRLSERRSEPSPSYHQPRKQSETIVSPDRKRMTIGSAPEALSRESKHTRVRRLSRSPSPEHPLLTEQNSRDEKELIDQFIAMGFERRDISSALFSCRGNAEKTLDVLINLRYHEF